MQPRGLRAGLGRGGSLQGNAERPPHDLHIMKMRNVFSPLGENGCGRTVPEVFREHSLVYIRITRGKNQQWVLDDKRRNWNNFTAIVGGKVPIGLEFGFRLEVEFKKKKKKILGLGWAVAIRFRFPRKVWG